MAVKNFNFKNPKMADGRHLEKCSVSVPDSALKKYKTLVSAIVDRFLNVFHWQVSKETMCVCEL